MRIILSQLMPCPFVYTAKSDSYYCLKGPLHTSPVDRAGSIAGTNFTLGSYEKFQSGFRDEAKDHGLSCIKPALKGAVSRNSAKLGNYKMLVKLRET